MLRLRNINRYKRRNNKIQRNLLSDFCFGFVRGSNFIWLTATASSILALRIHMKLILNSFFPICRTGSRENTSPYAIILMSSSPESTVTYTPCPCFFLLPLMSIPHSVTICLEWFLNLVLREQ